jgi:hypothetical protein
MDRLVEGTDDLEPAEALQAAISTTCAFWHSERALLRRLFAAAYEDRSTAALLDRREGWRRAQFAALLARLGDDLAAGLDLDGAADLLTAATSFPTYDRLGPAAEDPGAAARLLHHLARSLQDHRG